MQINTDFSLEEALITLEENGMDIVTCNIYETKQASTDPDDCVGVSHNGILDHEKSFKFWKFKK